MTSLRFNSIIILGVDREGGKRPAAVLVELAEKLQALQTKIMHVASQEVQTKVQPRVQAKVQATVLTRVPVHQGGRKRR